jgi:hypothetical protein
MVFGSLHRKEKEQSISENGHAKAYFMYGVCTIDEKAKEMHIKHGYVQVCSQFRHVGYGSLCTRGERRGADLLL